MEKPPHCAHEYNLFKYENESLIITRIADIITPEYLVLSKKNKDINLDQVSIHFTIGEKLIQVIPLSFLLFLNEPIICDDKMYINLCFDMFFGKIISVGIKETEQVKFKLVDYNSNNFNIPFEITSTISYYDTNERKIFKNTKISYFTQHISHINLMLSAKEFNFKLNFHGLSKGFFIQNENISSLTDIVLKINGMERFNLNKFLIKTKCMQISKNLIYFPFCFKKDFLDRSPLSFEGCINLDNSFCVKLELKFNLLTSNVKIYNLYANVYEQENGFGKLLYNYKN